MRADTDLATEAEPGSLGSAEPAYAEPQDRRMLVSLLLGSLLVLFFLAIRMSDPADVDEIATFVLVFASIVIEALPFILLGALVSSAMEVYVPERVFDRVGRLPLAVQLPGAALSGLAFPVCECGSVPVGRRLISRGVAPAAGVAFMLASPVMNPIVLSSTWVAYSGRGQGLEMVLGRAGLGLFVALVTGFVVARWAGKNILRPRPAVHHHHGHDHDGHDGHDHDVAMPRREAFAAHLTSDFLFMGKFIVLGAALAATLQTLIPQRAVSGVADTEVLAPLALSGLAFMLSLCSEADAFVAISFTAFSLGSQLAFLTFGPIMDTKLALLYGATFRRGFVLRVTLAALPLVIAGSILFDALVT